MAFEKAKKGASFCGIKYPISLTNFCKLLDSKFGGVIIFH